MCMGEAYRWLIEVAIICTLLGPVVARLALLVPRRFNAPLQGDSAQRHLIIEESTGAEGRASARVLGDDNWETRSIA